MKDDAEKDELTAEPDDSEETIRALQDYMQRKRVVPHEIVDDHLHITIEKAPNSMRDEEGTNQSGFAIGFKKYIKITFVAIILSILSGYAKYGFKEGLIGGPAFCGLIYQWLYVVPLGLYQIVILKNKKQGWFAVLGVLTGAVLFALYGLIVMWANFDPFYNFPA